MTSITRQFRLLAGLLFLTACGVAVEQAPQTSGTGSDTRTDAGSQLAAGGTGSAEMNAAAPDADATPPSDSDGLIIDNIIASHGKTETEPGVADPAPVPAPTEDSLSSTETVLAMLAPVIADSAKRLAPDTTPDAKSDTGTKDDAAPKSGPGSDTKTATETGAAAGKAVGDIIWNLESAQKDKTVPDSDTAQTPGDAEAEPVGPDESLASDALEAAFAMIANRNPLAAQQGFTLPRKPVAVTRVGLLIPTSGANAQFGMELQRGAELALFSMGDTSIELLVFDTAGGPRSEEAARAALAAEVDIIVGPLFSRSVVAARAIAGTRNVPMLSLSNNLDVADRTSWLLGYMPEQQIELLLGHALTAGHTKIAILAEDSPFGRRLSAHALRRLKQLGMTPEVVQTLSPAQLASEDQLKTAIQTFTGYEPPAKDEEAPAFADLPPPRFEAVVFAGGAEFALRTAPLLAYYDADSERVLYLGNAQWNQRRLLMEPSLHGALFASRPTDQDDKFNSLWTGIWDSRPGSLARLSFDAMAMITVVGKNRPQRWQSSLVANSGFNGFSGAYRLLPDGSNRRAFELRQIEAGVSILFRAAPEKI
ncbi:MAG: hypothetical protein CMM79_06985 [Rhodospirillaceae bacterium]|nr:hypothetical protein [Rhodospirillaceae bacterium]